MISNFFKNRFELLKKQSIFRQMFWTNVVVMLVCYIVICTILSAFINSYSTNRQVSQFKQASDVIKNLTITLKVENPNTSNDALYYRTISAYAKHTNSIIVITDSEGNVTFSSAAIAYIRKDYIKPVLEGKSMRATGTFGGIFNEKVLTVGEPIYYNDSVIGAVFFNTPVPNLYRSNLELMRLFIIAAIIALIVSFMLAYYQAKKMSDPIKEMNRAARDIANGKFTRITNIKENDEIGSLAKSFNFMSKSLEQLEDMRSSFISNVSHELRTPMTTITGFVGGILDGTIEPDKTNEYLSIVLDESKYMSRLVNDMLESSKINSGTYKLEPSSFNINELIRRNIVKLASRIEEKHITFEPYFETEPITVIADCDAISRVITNLLDNAIKFTVEGGLIRACVGCVADKVLVSVENTGIGIDDEEKDRIFERFYKTDKSRSMDKTGAGLGLYLVKNIIAEHGEQIHVESVFINDSFMPDGSPMKMTKFIFSLKKASED